MLPLSGLSFVGGSGRQAAGGCGWDPAAATDAATPVARADSVTGAGGRCAAGGAGGGTGSANGGVGGIAGGGPAASEPASR